MNGRDGGLVLLDVVCYTSVSRGRREITLVKDGLSDLTCAPFVLGVVNSL